MTRLACWLVLLGVCSAGIGWLSMGCGPTASGQEPSKEYVNSLGMKFMFIPKGRFVMGSPETEPDRQPDETAHEVFLTKDHYLGAHEVTQKQYEQVMKSNPSFFTPEGPGKAKVKSKSTDQHPVERVTYDNAVEFCRKLSQLADERELKFSYRLPSEAEWEYACRAGTSTPLYFGLRVNSYKANFNGLSPYNDGGPGPFYRTTSRVGEYEPNAFGLYDMHGNVQEWCNDWYAADYYAKSPKNDPPSPEKGTERVVRGGAWVNTGKSCRSAIRGKLPADKATYSTGFRIVLVVAP